jgi:hypothetical protein
LAVNGHSPACRSRNAFATFKAQIAEHVAKYAKRFEPGDHLVLVWDMIRKTQADTVLALWSADELKSAALRTGYIVPIEFVSADAGSHRRGSPAGRRGLTGGSAHGTRMDRRGIAADTDPRTATAARL